MKPRFSIVVPAFNASQTLAETLDAVRAQGFSDWQCTIVDDGSTDTTRQIAVEYAGMDGRFSVTRQANQGSAGAYNTGVKASSGDYIVLCSADDILLPRHLETMSAFIDSEPGFDIYSSNGFFWRPEEDTRELVYTPGQRDSVMSLTLADVIRLCFYSVGAAYRREWHVRVGGYRVDVFGEDYDFWLRAMASGAKHRYTPEALSLHRVSVTQKSADLERAYRSDIRLVSDLRGAFALSADELEAVETSIRLREELIAGLGASVGALPRVRRSLRALAVRLFGERGVRALAEQVRGLRRHV